MTEVEWIIERMSGPELQMLAERGYRLPGRLMVRLDAWLQEQHDEWLQDRPTDQAVLPRVNVA